MVQVTRDEMMKLRERFPGIRSTRTVHKYYVDENPRVIAFLKNGCRNGYKQKERMYA